MFKILKNKGCNLDWYKTLLSKPDYNQIQIGERDNSSAEKTVPVSLNGFSCSGLKNGIHTKKADGPPYHGSLVAYPIHHK